MENALRSTVVCAWMSERVALLAACPAAMSFVNGVFKSWSFVATDAFGENMFCAVNLSLPVRCRTRPFASMTLMRAPDPVPDMPVEPTAPLAGVNPL